MADNHPDKPGSGLKAKHLRETGPPYHAGEATLSPDEQDLVADLVADGLAIQEKFRPEPLYKETGTGYFKGNTVEEIKRSKGSKPRPK